MESIFLQKMGIEGWGDIHYGCRVDPSNIEGGEICAGCTHLKDTPRLHCGLSGLNLTGTLERSDYCKTHKQFQARD